MAQQDARIGQINGVDTKVCAVSGKDVSAGMIRYSLGNGYYFRVYPRYQSQVTEKLTNDLKSLISKTPKTKKVSEVTNNDD